MKTNNSHKKSKITSVVVGWMAAIVLASAASVRADTWTQKADMPTARMGVCTSVVDGKIYAISALKGLTRLKKVEEYDPVTDTWTEKADMPTARTFLATSVVEGKIFAIGGSTVWGGTSLPTVEAYDPVTDTWTKKADMLAPRDACGTSVVNGKIYAIGGYRGPSVVSTVEEYDPATDTWTRKANMPTARGLLSTDVVNGKIYAIGGQTQSTFAAFSTVEEYDPVTDTWTRKANMPAPRVALGTSVVDGKIYAFGGNARRGGTPLSTLFRYDPATDTWTSKDDMPVNNAGMGVSTVGGSIYVIGGSSANYPYNSVLSTVWEYDTGLRVSSPDINGDGVIDGADISIMVDHWHMDEPSCDIAPEPFGDGIVDVQDLVLLSEYLLKEVDDPTLVAHWALDETEGDIAQDSVIENNGYSDGYAMGNPIWQPNGGIVDGAIELDGVDDYIIIPPVLNPSVGPFSVLAWIKSDVAGQTIISALGGADWLSTDPSDGSLMTDLKAPDRSGAPLLSQAVITDNQWHRIGFIWDGSYRTLYVDSIAVAQDMQGSLTSSSNGLYIGTGSFMAPETYFSGLIDDVRIYNRAVKP